MTSIRSPILPFIGAATLAVALGWGLTVNEQLSFIVLVALVALIASAAPASAWVMAALVAALTFKGLVSVGVFPSVATFVDLPLAWGALFVALLKGRPHSRFVKRYLGWLVALGVAIVLASLFNRSEVLRPIVYLMLLGEPFAIAGALLADPPSARMRLVLERLLLALVLIQIPIAALQFSRFGPGDAIQGTLYGAGAGAHVMSAVAVVGAIWILAGGPSGNPLRVWRLPVVAALLVIPFAADAKQVILALPVMVLATSWRLGARQFALRGALVAVAVVALFTVAPAKETAAAYVEKNEQGRGGKQATATFLWEKVERDPASLAFGLGPAESVSRAAFMTLPGFANAGAFAVLGLKPAVIPDEAQANATRANNGNAPNSGESGMSSLLGVFGDLGLLGLLVYSGLCLTLFLRLRTVASPEGIAAACGIALFMVLGLFFDWWEQPPFGVFLGALAGLALTAEPLRRNASWSEPSSKT